MLKMLCNLTATYRIVIFSSSKLSDEEAMRMMSRNMQIFNMFTGIDQVNCGYYLSTTIQLFS